MASNDNEKLPGKIDHSLLTYTDQERV